MMFMVHFESALERVLPPDLPQRERVIAAGAKHLAMIAEANEYMNLTRITTPEEAAVKHVYDCIAPWRLFLSAERILDAGTGAGFPGIPLSVVLAQTRFTLAESVRKKARFVESVADELQLPNVRVVSERAEAVLTRERPDVITARAMAPMSKLIELFRKAVEAGTRLLLFKGPDVDAEIEEAKTARLSASVVHRYELPDGMGSRTVVELRRVAATGHPPPRPAEAPPFRQ